LSYQTSFFRRGRFRRGITIHMFQLDTSRTVGAIGTTLMIHIKVQFHQSISSLGQPSPEGVIDWPPAPWRILRAILAGSYNVALSDKHQPTLKALLHKLASASLYSAAHIPTFSTAVSPSGESKTAKVGPGKVLVALLMSSTQNALYIHYPLTLETEELVLSLCLSGLTYLVAKSRLQLLL